MFKFFVETKKGNSFLIDSHNIKHMKAARIFDENFICVYKEVFYLCKYENGLAVIIEKLPDNHEYKKDVVLAISIIDTKRLEWMIQKATELGVTRIIPMYSQNVSKRMSGDIEKKLKRWTQISKSAAEQSFRNKHAIIDSPKKFADVLNLNVKNKYIAYMQSSKTHKTFPTDSLFLIGPEGGFTQDEATMAIDNGFMPISLGNRTLRAETAGIYIMSRICE